MNKDELNLEEVRFINFFDYLALDLNFTNNYNFSSYYKLFEFINKDKNIKKFNNFNGNYNLLDLVNEYYNMNKKVKLYFNNYNLLVSINNGQFYYDFLIDFSYKIFKNYKNMPHFIGGLEEYIENFK